jgi:hypothetical protein
MTTKLITLFIALFLFFSHLTFAQRLDWEKVEDISTKPLAIAGDSTQLWAVVHNGIYTSRDTGLTWALSTEFTKKDVYSRIISAYGIDNVLLVGINHYTTNYTGCYDYSELKKFDKGEEIPNVAGASLCSTADRFCPLSTFGIGPEYIDATHFGFRNSSRRFDGRFCINEGTTKLLSEPNKYTLNFSNIESRYATNDNNSFYRDSGLIVAISDKKWLATVPNSTKLMYFQFDTINSLTYNFIKTRELPISSNNIKRYVHKNNRLYLFYGENKVYFTDNFGDNWQQDSLKINAEIKDVQILDSAFVLLTNKGLFKSNDLINYLVFANNLKDKRNCIFA